MAGNNYKGNILTLIKAISTPRKIAVIKALGAGSLNVSGIMEATELPQAVTSQCLIELRLLGIVSSTSLGTQRIYTLEIRKLLDLIGLLEEINESITVEV